MPPPLPSPDARAEHALAQRLESLARWVQELEARVRVTEVATGDEDVARELRTALAALARRDPALGERLDERIDVLGERLSGLAATVSATAAALARKDGELAVLRRELEAGRARIEEVAAELARKHDPDAVEELRRAVAALARDVAERRGREPLDALRGQIEALVQRLDGLAQTVATTAGGLAGREGELAALRRRVEALAAAASRTGPEPPDGRLDRLASRLAALAVPDDLAARVEDLARRLGSLEQGAQAAAPAPCPGDGRFRLELSSLELRMQHLESASRESREAVLTQLERLSSRMEWRLRRLEAERRRGSERHARVRAGGGQVVPIPERDG